MLYLKWSTQHGFDANTALDSASYFINISATYLLLYFTQSTNGSTSKYKWIDYVWEDQITNSALFTSCYRTINIFSKHKDLVLNILFNGITSEII